MSTSTSDLLTSYNTLATEIQQTINNNEQIYTNGIITMDTNNGFNGSGITAGSNVNKSFVNTLSNINISTPVQDISGSQTTIWDYFNKQYNEHTRLRKLYFEQIKKSTDYLNELLTEKSELENAITDFDNKNNSTINMIKHDKYIIHASLNEYKFFKYLIIIELLIILFIGIGVFDLLPKNTCLVFIVILLLLCGGIWYKFMIYDNSNRNKFIWEKRDWADYPVNDGGGQCSPIVAKTSDQIKQDALNAKIKQYVNNGSNANTNTDTSTTTPITN